MADASSLLGSASALLGITLALLAILPGMSARAKLRPQTITMIISWMMGLSVLFTISVISLALCSYDSMPTAVQIIGFLTLLSGLFMTFPLLIAIGLTGHVPNAKEE